MDGKNFLREYFMDANIVNTGKNAKSLLKMKMGKCIMT